MAAGGSRPEDADGRLARFAEACRRDPRLRERLARRPQQVLRAHGIVPGDEASARSLAERILGAGAEPGELSETDLAALAAGLYIKFDID